MARTILDDDLRTWEAFATTGPYGYADHALVVFHCTTDPAERPRAAKVRGDKSDAEAVVATASPEELRELFAGAEALD